MKTAADAIRHAYSHVGTTESPAGSNRTAFGRWYGMDGVAWCAIFVSYVVTGETGVLLPGRTTAKGFSYTPEMEKQARAHGLWHGPTDLRPGDLVLFQFDSDPEVDHVGIFVRYLDAAKTLALTVEGNTSPDDHGSQSNGGGVFERHRKVSLIRGAYRPPYAAPAPATPSWWKRTLRVTAPFMSGADVLHVQQRLIALHLIPAKAADGSSNADGKYGRITSGGVSKLQTAHHLNPTGVVDVTTAKAIG